MFEQFILAVTIVIPLFLMGFTGYLLNKFNFFSQTTFKQINNVVFTILLPIYLFLGISQSDLSAFNNGRLVLFVIVALFLTYMLALWITPIIEKDNCKRGVMIQGIIRSNYVILGFPLMAALYSEKETAITALILAISMPILNPMCIIALEMYRKQKPNFKELVIGILKNPLIIATCAGILALILQINFPVVLLRTATDLGRLGTPLALLALGGTMQFDSFRSNFKSLSVTLFLKLILIPSFALTAGILLGFSAIEVTALMILFATPTAVVSYTTAVKMEGDGQFAQQIVILSTILSVFTLVLWITLIQTIA